MLRATSCSESFFNVAGFIFGPLPSWSVDPEPAINSATGGCSTPAGVVSTASIGPTLIRLSSPLLCAIWLASVLPGSILLSWADALTISTESSRPRPARVARMGGLLDFPRFLRKHDRNAVPNGISEFGRARDQLLLCGVVLQRTLGHRTDQDFEQFGIDGVFRAFGRGVHSRAPAVDSMLTTAGVRVSSPCASAISISSAKTASCLGFGKGLSDMA